MLKIKDNVDLKELEKFGFKYNFNDTGYKPKYEWYEIDCSIQINISNTFDNARRIQCFVDDCSKFNEDVLYDLIKADLVEKVDDK